MSECGEAFIFLAPESTEVERKALRHSGDVTGLIWVPDGAAAADVAAELAVAERAVEAGADLIQVCGGEPLTRWFP